MALVNITLSQRARRPARPSAESAVVWCLVRVVYLYHDQYLMHIKEANIDMKKIWDSLSFTPAVPFLTIKISNPERKNTSNSNNSKNGIIR